MNNLQQRKEILSCPTVLAITDFSVQTLELEWLKLSVHVYLNAAFVSMESEWKFPEETQSESEPGFLFKFPTRSSTTVTGVSIVLQDGLAFDTAVVPNGKKTLMESATEVYRSIIKPKKSRGMERALQYCQTEEGRSVDSFNPDEFLIPFHGVQRGQKVKIYVDTIETMSSMYSIKNDQQQAHSFLSLIIPLRFLREQFASRVFIHAHVHLGETALLNAQSATHPLERIKNHFYYNPKKNQVVNNADFVFSYLMPQSNDITCLALFQPPIDRLAIIANGGDDDGIIGSTIQINQTSNNQDSKKLVKTKNISSNSNINAIPVAPAFHEVNGTLSLFLTPPSLSSAPSINSISRDIVFILDRSGSMGFSGVFYDAKTALRLGLDLLTPNDRFAICAFDHQQYWFSGKLPEMAALTKEEQVTMKSEKNVYVTKGDDDVYKPSQQVEMKRTETGKNDQLRPCMLEANEKYIKRAKEWIGSLEPGGKTDILTPLRHATYALGLSGIDNLDERCKPNSNRQSIVFLITDGAVENEREICKFVSSRMIESKNNFVHNLPKENYCTLSTFGIGMECNTYFLKMLASIGRGYCDIAPSLKEVEHQMLSLFAKFRQPIMCNVKLKSPPEFKIEDQIPSNIPDLCYGIPVVVAGSIMQQPENFDLKSKVIGSKLLLNGIMNGQVTERGMIVQDCGNIPLHKVFAKAKLEKLIAESWLANTETDLGKKLQQDAINLAVQEGIPCPYTQMVSYQTTVAQIQVARPEIQVARPVTEEELYKDMTADSGDEDAARFNKRLFRQRNKMLYNSLPSQRVVVGATLGIAAFGSIAVGAAVAAGAIDCNTCCDGNVVSALANM